MPSPSNLFSRVSAAARSHPLVKLRTRSPIPSTLSPSQASDSRRRIAGIPRLATERRCLGSMLPLHSAIASARLKSNISAESQSWGLIPQGQSTPKTPRHFRSHFGSSIRRSCVEF